MIILTEIKTPLGIMLAGAVNEGICLFDFEDSKMADRQLAGLKGSLGSDSMKGHHPLLEELRVQVDEYFCGNRRIFSLPLIYPASPFRCRVWDTLLNIPYGKTISYKEQAQLLGSPKAVRAVANANGANRIPIIIPCHRVIGADGKMTGYGGGLWRKEFLLELERKYSQ